MHAIDLPGFGASSKPLASYDPGFFARHVLRLMDALAIDRADLVGNSMGGRVALEVGLRAPSRVRTLSLLAPSMAFRRGRELVPLVRVLRPELGALPSVLRRSHVSDGFWRMIARPDRVDPAIADIAADEFLRTHRSRAARVAFYAAARQIYLEPPHGPSGFWTRLELLRPPALFVWGARTAWCRLASPATSARPCRRRGRSCWRTAGTCPRSSCPSEPTSWSATSSPRPGRRRGAAGGRLVRRRILNVFFSECAATSQPR